MRAVRSSVRCLMSRFGLCFSARHLHGIVVTVKLRFSRTVVMRYIALRRLMLGGAGLCLSLSFKSCFEKIGRFIYRMCHMFLIPLLISLFHSCAGSYLGRFVFEELSNLVHDVVGLEALLGHNLRCDPGG
ncbi:hypothetical protein GQ457_05G004020 [Hibiscus cannabinus]